MKPGRFYAAATPHRRALRRAAVLTGLVAVAQPTSAADYVSTTLGANPLAYWRLNAADQPSLVNGYATSYQNGVGTTTAGAGAPIAGDPANRAAVFDGINDATPPIVQTGLSGGIAGTGSINAWVNLAAMPSASGRIFYIAGESEFANDFDLQFSPSDRVGFCVGAGQCVEYTPAPASLVGQWHMVTASYDGRGDGSTDFSRIYFDGALVTDIAGDFSNSAHGAQFTMGYSTVFGNRAFNGGIDEVAVWNRALSAGEIAGLYASRLDPGAAAVPEPASWVMMLIGFGLIGRALRRRAGVRVVPG